MICGVNFRDEIMRMDRNHAPGPVVDLSAIAATFPGENITQAFKIFSYSFWKCHIFLGSLLCSLRFDFWGASTASWYQKEESRVTPGWSLNLLISCLNSFMDTSAWISWISHFSFAGNFTIEGRNYRHFYWNRCNGHRRGVRILNICGRF